MHSNESAAARVDDPIRADRTAGRPRPPSGLDANRLRKLGALAGIAGPVLLVVYFGTPALTGWPYAGAPAQQLTDYANSHSLLFYAGGWLQATGALLSILFFLALLMLSDAQLSFAGLVTIVGCAVLLSVVLIEAALLEAVPIAAHAGDTATVATTFALSNGVFARIFPLAPAPMVFAGIGYALRPAALSTAYARSARIVAAAFVIAGIAAVFSTIGLILAIVMSVVQAFWILAAAIALARSARPARQRPAGQPPRHNVEPSV
jgi:hypothetical protein